jgi:hypothetical protein
LLLRAVDETNREICRILVRLWAAGVHGGLDPLIATEKNATTFEISSIVEGWRADAQALMGWLDWSVWVKCRPACPFEVRFSPNYMNPAQTQGLRRKSVIYLRGPSSGTRRATQIGGMVHGRGLSPAVFDSLSRIPCCKLNNRIQGSFNISTFF